MLTREHLLQLDRQDPLAALRDQFVLPAGTIYLDGNSLGAMPRAAADRVRRTLDHDWSQALVRSWNSAGWVDLPQRVGDRIGRLIGAREGETLACDSTSVNLFKLLSLAVKLRPGRKLILSDCENFPTDLYIAEGLSALLGGGLELRSVSPGEIEAAIDERVAVVSLSHVNYRNGALYDMAAITQRAHNAGALMLWDLAHSAGALPIHLAACDVDLAVGCGYKYFNGGPGAPAFLYIAQRLQAQASTPLSGWFGHQRPFDFVPVYAPAAGISRMLAGTPAILSIVSLDAALDVWTGVSMEQVRAKSILQCESFVALVEQWMPGVFELVSPRESAKRGSQVCLRHAEAWPIMQALIARGVIGDVRAPDILRFGFTPLYLSYAEVWDAASTLREIIDADSWRQPHYQIRAKVT
ncbi:MAG: kynureninase [Hydrocarboniphaga sp.]|uniref:kynureninase n=1 Tax=Hydrocarboniphaga sp. TaxID=2033016 RepID=UPI002602F083|nr:kynureninase [Hydrocarboniphaga sp.]MDB5972359.1 kynureninase [Hydrocarboniphaga sp.]